MVLYTEKVDVEMPIMNKNKPELNIPKTKFLGYSFNGTGYLFRNSGEVFWLYKETNTSSEGLLLKGKSGLYVIKSSEGEFKVYFDASESFVIQKGTVSETYKRID